MKFVVYPSRRMYGLGPLEYRWRLVAANGNNIATSGEGYARRVDCLAAIRSIRHPNKGASQAIIEDHAGERITRWDEAAA